MRQATVRSRCECQSLLVATLNDQRFVVNAYAVDPNGNMETAPAHMMASTQDRFDVGWLCNVCGRNTLRSFSADALVWIDTSAHPG